MSESVPIDKKFRFFFPLDRPYTRLEAMVDYTIDRYEYINTPINRYAKNWGWSRNKVRKFIEDINNAKGHQKDTSWTADGHSVTFINKGLRKQKDTKRTVEGQAKDSFDNRNGKIKYSEYVSMEEKEYAKLVEDNGEDFTKACIVRLNNYKGANGKEYKSDYLAILNWVIQREKQTGEWEEDETEEEGRSQW